MADFLDRLRDKANEYTADYLNEKGLQVHLKTDFGPAIKVYDADAPGGNDSKLPIKYSVMITNREGKIIKQLNDAPKTNPLKAAALVGVLGIGTFVIISGLARIIGK